MGRRRHQNLSQHCLSGVMSMLQPIARFNKVLALGLFIAIAGMWLMVSCFISIANVRGTGTVVRLVQQGHGNDVIYCPVAIFHDSAGIAHTISSSAGSNPPRFPVGSTVTILYKAQNPDGGMIEDRFMLWIAPSLIIVISTIFLSVGHIISRLPDGVVKQYLTKIDRL